jgi:hypothetical protein
VTRCATCSTRRCGNGSPVGRHCEERVSATRQSPAKRAKRSEIASLRSGITCHRCSSTDAPNAAETLDFLPIDACRRALSLYPREPHGRPFMVFRFVANGGKPDMGKGSCRELSRDEAIDKIAELQAQRKAGIDPLAARRAHVMSDAVKVPMFRQAMLVSYAEQAKDGSRATSTHGLRKMERGSACPRSATWRSTRSRLPTCRARSPDGRSTTEPQPIPRPNRKGARRREDSRSPGDGGPLTHR